RDVEAERVLVATAMQQPNIVDELGAEGFDPADITTDAYRWTWWAVEELQGQFRDGELKHLAVHRLLETWHAEGRMVTRPPAAGRGAAGLGAAGTTPHAYRAAWRAVAHPQGQSRAGPPTHLAVPRPPRTSPAEGRMATRPPAAGHPLARFQAAHPGGAAWSAK